MEMTTVFANGGSQAVRIPRPFRFQTHRVSVQSFRGGVLLMPVPERPSLKDVFATLQRASAGEETLRISFPVQSWDSSAAEVYSDIRAQMERGGHPIGNMDLMIAASAIATGSTLVTNNERHFRAVPGLAFVNWARE